MTSGQTVAVHLAPQPPAPPVAIVTPPPPVPEPPPAAPARDDEPHGNSGAMRIGMTVGLGVGAVVLAVGGVYFGTKSNSAGSDGDQIQSGLQASSCRGSAVPASCGQLSDDRNSANSDHTASIALYATAGVLAAGAVASFLFLPKASDTRSAVIPIVGPGLAGAGWATTF